MEKQLSAKGVLERDELRQPHGRGVEYFKRTLRPHVVKGAQTVFLFRFMTFMKNNHGNSDLMKRMTRFQIDGRTRAESWMGLLPDYQLFNLKCFYAGRTTMRNKLLS